MYTILICDYVQEIDYGALDAKHYAQGTNRYVPGTSRYTLDTKGEVSSSQSICTGYQGRGAMRKGIWLKSMLV